MPLIRGQRSDSTENTFTGLEKEDCLSRQGSEEFQA